MTGDSGDPGSNGNLPAVVSEVISAFHSLEGVPEGTRWNGGTCEWEGWAHRTRVEIEAVPGAGDDRLAEVRIVSRLPEQVFPELPNRSLHEINREAGFGVIRRRADGGLEVAGAAVVNMVGRAGAVAHLAHVVQAARVMGEGGFALISLELHPEDEHVETAREELGFPRGWEVEPTEAEFRTAREAILRGGRVIECREEDRILELYVDTGRWAAIGNGFQEPVPWNTVQVGMDWDLEHTVFGPGYRSGAELKLPGQWSVERTAALAEELNLAEQAHHGWAVPRLGAWWCDNWEAGRLAYSSFYPTDCPVPGILEQLAAGMVERVRWVAGRLGEPDGA